MNSTTYRRFMSFINETTRWASKTRARREPVLAAFASEVQQLEQRKLLTVTFQGGAILTHVETQAVFLGSDWQTTSTFNSQTTSFNNYLTALVSGSYMDMLTNAGYGVGRGTSKAGVIDKLTLNKTNGVTDAQIQSDLQTLIQSKTVQTPDANRLYVVYVEPGVAVYDHDGTNSISDFLGYHSAFAGHTVTNGSIDIHYAVLPYPGGPNPTPQSQGFSTAFNELTVVTSHEVAEAVTDPNVGYKASGWYDNDLNGEIADLTDLTATVSGYLVQQVVNKHDGAINPNNVQPPQSIAVKAVSSNSARVTWANVIGATGYRVYEIVGVKTILIATVSSTATSYQINKLLAGSTVSFKIEAFNQVSKADTPIVVVKLPK